MNDICGTTHALWHHLNFRIVGASSTPNVKIVAAYEWHTDQNTAHL